ncbi:cation transporter [Pseudomonas kuykendallii]|uniref:Copper chaperone n=1 Tax=Pseudomonas kuykendallii TaxID=1007099 RepID=A0A1H2V408_9PSED|nr:cation transporter [Pseudomonas kuykendallii]MCQ4271316.1 cation transporter [Pseudomonas kuykendallii]SDW63092.1 copper chaperone [Pseudomonas kuykendallii]
MQIFKVQGMTCGHCVRAVTAALQGVDPQARVEVDLAAKEVRVESEAEARALIEAIREEGYQVDAA